MTCNSVARYDLQVHAGLGPCRASVWPGAAKLPLCRRETKSIGPAPAISKRAMATKAKPRAFHLFSVVASNARSRLKFP
jgi:hypothetical protein